MNDASQETQVRVDSYTRFCLTVIAILMTVLTAALALLPLAIAGNRPGHEIEYPMALVILGGLLTSTLMNLFLIPSLYRAFGHVKRRAAFGDDAN